jgi:hypothetical protein
MTETGGIAGYKLQMLVLERRNGSRNMGRFYVLAIEPTLFGEMARASGGLCAPNAQLFDRDGINVRSNKSKTYFQGDGGGCPAANKRIEDQLSGGSKSAQEVGDSALGLAPMVEALVVGDAQSDIVANPFALIRAVDKPEYRLPRSMNVSLLNLCFLTRRQIP